MSSIPVYIRGDLSSRQWRAKKRAELKAIADAYANYRLGCAYCPGFAGGEINDLERTIDNLRRLHSVKEWG